MSTRDQKGRSTFGKRTKTAHKWFDLLPKKKKREAEKVAIKWNQEGHQSSNRWCECFVIHLVFTFMDLHSSYCKKNLKNVTNEFLGVLRHMMGVHTIMLVGYKKNVGMATALCIHFALQDNLHTDCL